MPELYYEMTTPAERARHEAKLARLASPRELLIEAEPDGAGGWLAEMVTTDWDEPGLLDRIFEAVIACLHIPGGITIHRIRVFTGRHGQVANILEFRDRRGGPFSRENCEQLLERLRQIRPGERAILETITGVKLKILIPTLTTFPSIDNTRSEHFTHLAFALPRMSARFTSILLHYLARSEFQVNVQVAEFRQAEQARYSLYVVDKRGRKFGDRHFTRISLVRALEEMNRMILRFNLHSVRRSWAQRIERNDRTIYRSRPDPQDFLDDMEAIRQLAALKGIESRPGLTVERGLVDGGLLDARSLEFLTRFEAFCEEQAPALQGLVDAVPGERETALCREYFEQRRRSLRILEPLYARLMRLEPIRPELEDRLRLEALARPWERDGYALDPDMRLYRVGGAERSELDAVFQPFLLLARTGCALRGGTIEAIEAALERWSAVDWAAQRAETGARFQEILDEGMRQGNLAPVLRGMRQVGLLQRLVPGFARITGLIHVVSDHRYTVDEHSILLVEALAGMELLLEVLPERGTSPMRRDYEKLTNAVGLSLFARKYAIEERTLRAIPQARSHPAIAPFLQWLDEVRENSLEYLVEMKVLEYSRAICLTALRQIEEIRAELDTLLRHYAALTAEARRDLALAALLHDMDKPDQDHGRSFAPRVGECLEQMGLAVAPASARRIAWLVAHHLDLSGLLSRIGGEGEGALAGFVREHGAERVRELILFACADRVAVNPDPNVASHNAMVLTGLLRAVDRIERGEEPDEAQEDSAPRAPAV
jgi:hypothetical protein